MAFSIAIGKRSRQWTLPHVIAADGWRVSVRRVDRVAFLHAAFVHVGIKEVAIGMLNTFAKANPWTPSGRI